MRSSRVPLLALATIMLIFLLAACRGQATLEPPDAAGVPSATLAGPGYQVDLPAPPSPTANPAGAAPSAAGPGSAQPDVFSSLVASTTTVASTAAPDWTCYRSINEIWKLSFAPDGALWAITSGGLVRWDLDTGTYMLYQIDATDMAPAPDGTLWLATEDGLCRFHGTRCELADSGDAPGEGAIHAVAVMPEGTVWVGTDSGVSRFDGQAWRGYASDVPTVDLAVGTGGELWAATAGGLGRYLPSQDTWLTLTDQDGLPGMQATAVAVGPGGDLWVNLAWQGVYRFDGQVWQAVSEVPGGIVSDIAFASDGTPWVGTVGSLHYPGGSLAYWNGERWVDVSSQHGLTSIGAVALGPGNVVAASTSLGLGIYEAGNWRWLRDGPVSDHVTSVAVTPDGAAWLAFGDHSISTTGAGVSRYDGREWSYSLDDAEVDVLAVAPDGSLWAGVGCSVQRFDGHSWHKVARCEDLSPGNVSDIAFTADGAAWVTNGFGLARFDGAAWVVYDRLANAVLSAPDGAVWVIGWDGSQGSEYVARFDGEEWTAYKSGNAFPGRFVAGAVTPDGLVWGMVPERGLASFDGRSWTEPSSWDVYALPEGVSLEGGLGLAVAPDGALWMRTAGGVARFDPAAARAGLDEGVSSSAWTLYAAPEGRCGNTSWPIAFGPGGEIWIGASRFRLTGSPGAP